MQKQRGPQPNDRVEKNPTLVQRLGIRDQWEFIIKIIIAILVIIWFIQQIIQRQQLDPFSLIILLIVLAVIVWLILYQRHFVQLRCNLTAPSGCIQGSDTILAGRVLEIVGGTAGGWGFDHYLVELRDPGGNLLSNVVVYPNASSAPDTARTQGDFAVNSGTLGWIDVEAAATAAGSTLLTSTTFEVTLRVFGVDGSEMTPPCTISFQLSVNEVFIRRISTPWAVDFTSPLEDLHVSETGGALATIGGGMHVRGAANVRGCATQKIQEYTIWAIPDPGFTFAQPAPLSSVTPAANWVQITHIVYTAITASDGTSYTADEVRAKNTLDGRPQPDILTNVWGEVTEHLWLWVDSTFLDLHWQVPTLMPSAFDSNGSLLPHKLSPQHVGGTGKFTFLLQVIDTSGNKFYDIQRAWIDNEPIHALISGIAGLAPCTDLYTRTHAGAFKTVDVEGTAWDELIDPTGPDLTQPTSDNFGSYTVSFNKQGAVSGAVQIQSSTSPIPARPNPVGIGVLGNWDLSWVDAGLNPQGLPADQLLAKGEACTYDVILTATDLTVVSESTNHSSGTITFPIKIINDNEP